jgi:hypothetical protein
LPDEVPCGQTEIILTFINPERGRGKMADIPLQKSKSGLTSADVLDYLREEKC